MTIDSSESYPGLVKLEGTGMVKDDKRMRVRKEDKPITSLWTLRTIEWHEIQMVGEGVTLG